MNELSKLIESEVADFFAGFGGPGEPDIQSGEAQQQLTERLLSLLALRERAEPVAYISKADLDAGYPHILARKEYSKACPMAVYSAPPAPVVPDELLTAMEEVLRISDRQHDAWDKAKAAVSACRAAMTAQPTKANNAIGQYQGADGMPHDIVTLGRTACKDEPVSNPYKLPDGWVAVPVEPTEQMIMAAVPNCEEAFSELVDAYRLIIAASPAPGKEG